MTTWTVVLAAGAGRRLAAVTGGVPKQFWRAAGGRSLLRQTLERFEPIAPRSRTVVVVDAAHRDHVTASDVVPWASDFVVQPLDRGTATGVLLGLAPVLAQDPDGIVVITPSDHGVLDTRRFRQSLHEATRHVCARDAIVLFGAEPSAAQTDYGWISLGQAAAPGGLKPVTSFVEKPSRETAGRLFAAGAVWNTMVIAARARAIWDLYAQRLPELADLFSLVVKRAPAERRALLAAAYREIAPRDFSRDVLTNAPGLSACVWPTAFGWSDLGTPERLYAWQRASASRPRPLERRVSQLAGFDVAVPVSAHSL